MTDKAEPVKIAERWASDDQPVRVVSPPTEQATHPKTVLEDAKPAESQDH